MQICYASHCQHPRTRVRSSFADCNTRVRWTAGLQTQVVRKEACRSLHGFRGVRSNQFDLGIRGEHEPSAVRTRVIAQRTATRLSSQHGEQRVSTATK